MPSPEQIDAALPAMREWCASHTPPSIPARWWSTAPSLQVRIRICVYPGGVEQFIADQEEPDA